MGRNKGLGKGTHGSKKRKVLALVDRDTKQAKSVVMSKTTIEALQPVIAANVERKAQLMTDGARQYKVIGKDYADNHVVNHTHGEYVLRDNPEIHTNTVENYFSVFKRGRKGTYQHCAHNHLNRYLAEFDFRYNHRSALKVNDTERAEALLAGIVGKRLTYERTVE